MATQKRPVSQNKTVKKVRWTDAQIDLLLDVWGEKIVELRGARRNAHVFAEMVVVLAANEVDTTAEEIRTRINNLTAKYRKEKRSVGTTGGAPSRWLHYEKVHSILGTFPINNAASFVVESLPDEEIQNVEEFLHDDTADIEAEMRASLTDSPAVSPNISSTPIPGPSSKRKRSNTEKILDRVDGIEESIREQLEYAREQDRKMLDLEMRRVELLEKFTDGSIELKNAFIAYLNRN